MVYRRGWKAGLAVAGLIGAAFLVFDSAQHALWANLALGLALIVGLAAYLLSLEASGKDEPAPPLRPVAGGRVAVDEVALLADQVPLPLLEYRTGARLFAVNRAARTLFQTDDLVTSPPEELIEAIERRDPGAPRPVRVRGRAYALGLSEIQASDGSSLCLISLTDIQSEVRMAEATALRDLLRVLSHEIMNSLTPVASLAEIARTYLEGEPGDAVRSAREALELLEQRAVHLSRFVESYRALARLPDPVRRRCDSRALLKDIVQVFKQSAAAKYVTIELYLPDDCPEIDIDDSLMSQALLNVLTNAAEATVNGDAPGRVGVSLTVEPDEVRISVCDNGTGVDDELAGQIFHAFVTTKPNGTGTGLNLARQIALAHGGDLIFVGSNGPWRSVFCFVLHGLPESARADDRLRGPELP